MYCFAKASTKRINSKKILKQKSHENELEASNTHALIV